MSSFEYEGKNVARAVEKACEELNLIKDDISYEVLTYGSSGIFGLVGAKKARILVNLPEKTDDPILETETVNPAAEYSDDQEATADQTREGRDTGDRQLYEFPENPLELGRAVLQRIVNTLTDDAQISAEEDPERLLLNVSGGNAGIIIGKKGQTLEAIQSLVEKIVNKHHTNNNSHKIRVQVDVEGYLENRKTNLEKLAVRLAEKSKQTRKPISLGQMNPHDRRIVHLALKDDPGVRTKSRGEGYMRKLVIFPKKNSLQKQPLH